MAKGVLAEVDSSSGRGLLVRGSYTGRMLVGVGLNASKRGVVNLATEVEGPYKAEKALLELGMTLPRGVRLPLRMKIILDGLTVSREFKPQFLGEGDDSIYAKAIYDVKPLVASKLASRPRHRLVVIYDSSKIVGLDEASLVAVYDVEGAWYSYTLRSGVMSVKPGEEVIVSAKLPESRMKVKGLYVNLVVPSRFSDIEVRAGNSVKIVSGVQGPVLVEGSFASPGDAVRVSINYRGLAGSAAQTTAYITGVMVVESQVPRASLRITSVEAENEGGGLLVKARVANTGARTPDKVMLLVTALGIPLARVPVDTVEPGAEVSVETKVDLSKLPAPTDRVSVRVVWVNYGRPFFDEAEVKIKSKRRQAPS